MRTILASALVFCFTSTLLAQPPAPAKPSPELQKLAKQLVGTWDCTVKAGEGGTKGTSTYKVELGGLWILGRFEGEFEFGKFSGQSLETYDPAKKKFVSVWIDSMSNSPMVSEGTLEGKKLTLVGMGAGPDGKKARHRMATTFNSKDSMTFQMYMGPEGKDQLIMTIDYKRKK